MAGVVHKGEYVVPQPEMNNPKVIDAVSTIEAIRRQRTNANPLPQNPGEYAEGGYVTSYAGDSSYREFLEAAKELRLRSRFQVRRKISTAMLFSYWTALLLQIRR